MLFEKWLCVLAFWLVLYQSRKTKSFNKINQNVIISDSDIPGAIMYKSGQDFTEINKIFTLFLMITFPSQSSKPFCIKGKHCMLDP